MSWQMLNAMFQENYYHNLKQQKALDRGKNKDSDDSEWIELPDFDNPGQMKRIKKMKNPLNAE